MRIKEGIYFRNGVWLENDSRVRLLIKERKKYLEKKPSKYLMIVQNEKYEYVSSLYKTAENEYTFDNKEKQYRMKLEQDRAEIRAVTD